VQLHGPRVTLRPWRSEDRAPFAAINAEPGVLRYLLPMTAADSDAMFDRLDAHFAANGWGYWAVERREAGGLIGFCGLMPLSWTAFFTPALEISWRISPRWQKQGLALEAATLALDAAFGPLGLDRVVSLTVPANVASWRLMERLGMREIGAFDHPRPPPGHPLKRHVAYEITAARWVTSRSSDPRGTQTA
jgi:RimJ/RimL family protein N-acetyltransferase